MKRIISLCMLGILFLMLSACTSTTAFRIVGDYNKETNEYVISNISNNNYEELEVVLMIENEKGHSKSFIYDVGDLKAGEDSIIDMSDVENISDITFEEYAYYVSPLPYIFSLILIFGFIITVIIVQ